MSTAENLPMPDAGAKPLNARKTQILEHANRIAAERGQWIERNQAYYDDDRNFMRFLVPKGSRVLDLGCGTGELLAALEPSHGVGVDLSPNMIALARANHPNLTFHVGDIENPATLSAVQGPFDYIILSDTIGMLDDIESALGLLHRLCGPSTRVIIAYYSRLWEPVLTLVEWLGLRMPQPPLNYLVNNDFLNIIDLADFEPIKAEYRQLVPRRLFGLGTLINKFIAPMPGIRRAVPAQLFRRALAQGQSAHRHVGEHHHPLPQRARKYRDRDHAHAGLRERAGDRLYRGQFFRRHL